MAMRPDVPVRPVTADAAATPARVQFAELTAGYRPAQGHFDELLDASGAPRSHWQGFADHAGSLRSADIGRRQSQIARQIHENGVTYNVYASADGPARPWGLDALPMIIPAAEWDVLAQGLRQRARVLNAMVADLYGEQRLLTEGLLPPALVLGHPGFLRGCTGVKVPGGVHLHQIAFDLARDAAGRWRIVGKRIQAPSGAGYALENRLTVSRLYPDAFRDMRVQLLAQFFRTLQASLIDAAPTRGEAPHIVLLTPGPYNETYFEHSYLARYLGFTLAEGGDLTVRDDELYLKTLTGLQRVHVLLRRLDDDFCDPLELRSDSTLGVPGLMQAWRRGNVLVANALGAGMLESPALSGFLPAVCERLLGESLALPSVASWWCGEAAALDDAMSRFARMVIKPAFPDLRLEPVFVSSLDRNGRARWAARLRAAPERYVLQEYLPLSQVPAWHGGHLESRGLMLRVFLVADGKGDYSVMPGGLSRISGPDRHLVSGQRGGSSKDTWVLSDAPIEPFSLLPGRLRPEDILRSQRAVSSRAGESLFWLGRYAERSENCARLLRAVLSRLPASDEMRPEIYRPIVRTCFRNGLLRVEREEYAAAPQLLETDLIGAMFDRRASLSLAYNIEQTVRVAGAVRDRLSADNWRLVNQLFQSLALDAQQGGLAEALELIDRAIVSLVAIGGLEVEHMTRDEGWRFLSLGRYIERLLFVAGTASEVARSGMADDPAALDWLLDLSDSSITYRARYMRQPEWLAVADLLLFDRRNPRSAAFQLGKLAGQVRQLPEADLAEILGEIDRAIAACAAGRMGEGDLFGPTAKLDGFLALCEALGMRLSDTLALRYFSHVYESTQATAIL
jgi:uncharacterized circularly permuted ATP-grasp superfamily protein/uncharacterized alpha-E superfamily protein